MVPRVPGPILGEVCDQPSAARQAVTVKQSTVGHQLSAKALVKVVIADRLMLPRPLAGPQAGNLQLTTHRQAVGQTTARRQFLRPIANQATARRQFLRPIANQTTARRQFLRPIANQATARRQFRCPMANQATARHQFRCRFLRQTKGCSRFAVDS
ncbi:hypothetical protein QUA56_17465 [Microcoleus sp. N3A4]|uniref:hypothetical protein n=1 Tax=Microcoleus sp. N3A4 TaxID=3055379 RepID=UPI002FD541BB